jgi:hypothetical protein
MKRRPVMSADEWVNEDDEGASSHPLDDLLECYGSDLEVDEAVRAFLAPYALSDCVLVSPDGRAVLAIVPGDEPPAVVVADPAKGEERIYQDFGAALSEDPRLRLTPEAEIVLGDRVEPWCLGDEYLRFSVEAWKGVNRDLVSTGGDEWQITVNGDRIPIDLDRCVLVTQQPVKAKAGCILHIDWGPGEDPGYSRLSVDERGLVWYREDSCVGTHFLVGPAQPPLSRYLAAFLEGFSDGTWNNGEFAASTDLLTREEMAAALRFLAEGVGVDLDDWCGTGISVEVGSESLSFEELMGFETQDEDDED